MRCIRIGTFPSLDREFKRLAKKYKSLTQDLQILVNELRDNPYLGTDLGNGLLKVRMAIAAKGKGKSGGARVITFSVIISSTDADIKLLIIYDKSERETITDKELRELLKRNGVL